MESGKIRQRRRYVGGRYSVTVQWEMTDEEFKIFQRFVLWGLSSGNDWFDIPLLSSGGVVSHRARIQKGDYQSTYQDYMNWVVKANLDIESIQTYSDEETFLIIYGEENIVKWSNLLYPVVNKNMPEEITWPT